MAHSLVVSQAIQLVLHNIDFLDALVVAPNEAAARAALPTDLAGLTDDEWAEFYESLKKGSLKLDAEELADFYHGLAEKRTSRAQLPARSGFRGRPREWNP